MELLAQEPTEAPLQFYASLGGIAKCFYVCTYIYSGNHAHIPVLTRICLFEHSLCAMVLSSVFSSLLHCLEGGGMISGQLAQNKTLGSPEHPPPWHHGLIFSHASSLFFLLFTHCRCLHPSYWGWGWRWRLLRQALASTPGTLVPFSEGCPFSKSQSPL